ncbi:MAG: hypothetical protein MZV70_59405 [Desulfobacterales bacterium]|nr:hypothetical protein [Desulfobacterales bacterium]
MSVSAGEAGGKDKGVVLFRNVLLPDAEIDISWCDVVTFKGREKGRQEAVFLLRDGNRPV